MGSTELILHLVDIRKRLSESRRVPAGKFA